MATLYPIGDPREIFPKSGVAFSFDELRSIVGGRVETVALPSGGRIVVNEDGKVDGLQDNPEATALWKREYPIELYPGNNDESIVGVALVASDTELGY